MLFYCHETFDAIPQFEQDLFDKTPMMEQSL